jgi:hypothetical protein
VGHQLDDPRVIGPDDYDWGAFISLKRQYVKVYAVLDLNRMDLNTEEFRHYMKEHWLPLLDRRDLVIVFVDKSRLKKAIWNSIALLLGRPGRVKIFTTSDVAFAWVKRAIVVNGNVVGNER